MHKRLCPTAFFYILGRTMKHFVVEILFSVPFEQVEPVVPAHREFLQIGYDAGQLLMSGPQNPRVGGIVIARAESLEVVQALFAQDPYALNKVATYRFIEFNPVKRQPFLESWIA